MKAAAIPPEVVPGLTDALRDPEVQVRANAAHALARLDVLPADSVAALIDCASYPRDDLRMNATLALCKASAGRASEVFAQRIGDPNPRIRLIAARFLLTQDPGNAEATAVVTAALVDPVQRLRKSAIDLIDSLGPQGAGWGDALKQQSLLEEEPALRDALTRLIERLDSEAIPETPINVKAEGLAETLPRYDTVS
jgi:HEAT repeat protein